MRRHLSERFPDLREFAAVPEELLTVMERTSRRLPDERYATAAEMRRAVERVLELPEESGEGAASSGRSRRIRVEESINALEGELTMARVKADSGTQLAALRSLYGLYTQLDRREDATKVFREALVLHVRMNEPRRRSLN